MGRPRKSTIDYFPHDTDSGSGTTISILRRKHGNDGYAAWFSILELLGRSNGLYFDFSHPAKWEHLQAETYVYGDDLFAILDTLAALEAIDPELYEHKILWVQNLVDNTKDAFRLRQAEIPKKPAINSQNSVSTEENIVSTVETPISSVESTERESEIKGKVKGKERDNARARATHTPGLVEPVNGQGALFEKFAESYPTNTGMTEARIAWAILDPDEITARKIISSLEAFKASDDWKDKRGMYIPGMDKFLRERRWEKPPPIADDDRDDEYDASERFEEHRKRMRELYGAEV
jgi:hypothetical protein